MTSLLDPESVNAREQALDIAARQRGLRRPPSHPIAEPLPGTRDDDDALDLRQYWNILLRRKWTLLIAVAVALAAGLVVTYNTTPIYRSSLSLQIDLPNLAMTGLDSEAALGASYMYAMSYQNTQIDVLKSRALARRVIDQLGLELSHKQPTEGSTTSYLAELKSTFQAWITGADKTLENNEPVEKRAKRKPDAAGALLANLSIESTTNSQVIRLTYESPRPAEAASVANAIAENFIEMNLERRYDSTSYAERFLAERIKQVRANLDDSERRLVAYAREREIVDVDNKLGTLMQTLNALSAKLVQAEADRIKAESEYTQAVDGTGPAIVKIMESPVIQELKRRKGELEMEYQGQPKIYKPDYPIMKQLRSQIAEVDQQIDAEIAAINDAVKASHEAKVREQATLQARVNEVKGEILALQDRSTDYQALKREVETNRNIYDGLLQRMKEVGVVAGIATNNISIVDRALAPTAPFKPNLQKNLLIALLLGLAGGILLAFLFERLDDTIKTNEDVESRIRAPVLGVIPLISPKDYGSKSEQMALIAAKHPKSALAEASRSLQTALSFSTAEGAPRIMHFTSPIAGDGKTMTAVNVAVAFARAGSKVLLVDADLRNPSLHRIFDLPNTLGLTNHLAGDTKPGHIAQPTEVDGLFAITSGPLPPSPVELLTSAKMFDLLNLIAERFDYVILDSPPVVGLADAVVLSKLAHGTIFVVHAMRTRYGDIEGSIKRLHDANANILGAVIDAYDHTGKRYGYGYGYGYGYKYSYRYHYSYDYGAGSQTATLPEKA